MYRLLKACSLVLLTSLIGWSVSATEIPPIPPFPLPPEPLPVYDVTLEIPPSNSTVTLNKDGKIEMGGFYSPDPLPYGYLVVVTIKDKNGKVLSERPAYCEKGVWTRASTVDPGEGYSITAWIVGTATYDQHNNITVAP